MGVVEYWVFGSPEKPFDLPEADPSFGGASVAPFNRDAPFKRFDRLERIEQFELKVNYVLV